MPAQALTISFTSLRLSNVLLTFPAHPSLSYHSGMSTVEESRFVGIIDNGTGLLFSSTEKYGGVESARHRYAYIRSTAPSEPQQLFPETGGAGGSGQLALAGSIIRYPGK